MAGTNGQSGPARVAPRLVESGAACHDVLLARDLDHALELAQKRGQTKRRALTAIRRWLREAGAR